MPTLTRRTAVPVPPERLWEWHTRAAAFERLVPPWERLEMRRWAPIAEGAAQEMRVRQLGRWWSWTARIRDVQPGTAFTDVQEGGPFARWEHTHRVLPDPAGAAVEDQLDWAPPLGPLGMWVAGPMLSRTIARTFAFRHRRTHEDMARLAAYALPASVAITGASGLIGAALAAFLEAGGTRVVRLGRRATGPGQARFDPEAGVIDRGALEGVEAVVHLAGEPVAQRWTPAARARIRASRVDGTHLLASALAGLDGKPRVLVSGSAIGVYGDRGDEPLTEDSAPGQGFLPEIGEAWEAATAPAEAAGIRTVHLRTGIVLTPAGAALGKQLPLYRLGLGGPLGGGRQWTSWITLDDLIGLILHALATEALRGPLNAVGPEPVRQAEFARVLGAVLRRPALAPAPAFAVRAVLGEMSEIVLDSQRVLPEAALRTGFAFHHPHLEDALRFLLGREVPRPSPE